MSREGPADEMGEGELRPEATQDEGERLERMGRGMEETLAPREGDDLDTTDTTTRQAGETTDTPGPATTPNRANAGKGSRAHQHTGEPARRSTSAATTRLRLRPYGAQRWCEPSGSITTVAGESCVCSIQRLYSQRQFCSKTNSFDLNSNGRLE